MMGRRLELAHDFMAFATLVAAIGFLGLDDPDAATWHLILAVFWILLGNRYRADRD